MDYINQIIQEHVGKLLKANNYAIQDTTRYRVRAIRGLPSGESQILLLLIKKNYLTIDSWTEFNQGQAVKNYHGLAVELNDPMLFDDIEQLVKQPYSQSCITNCELAWEGDCVDLPGFDE